MHLTYKRLVENQTSLKIKCLRTDSGKEFVNKAFNDFMSSCGIRRQLPVPYTPQQSEVTRAVS